MIKSSFNFDLLKPVAKKVSRAPMDTWSALEKALEEPEDQEQEDPEVTRYHAWPSDMVYTIPDSWDNDEPNYAADGTPD